MLIGFCFCGSFCTLSKSLVVLQELVDKGHKIIPIFSYNVCNLDTRFWNAKDFRQKVEEITGEKIVDSIVSAEIGRAHV